LSRNTVLRLARGNKITKLRLVPTLRFTAVRSFYKTIQCDGANYVNVQFMKHFHRFLRNIGSYGDFSSLFEPTTGSVRTWLHS